MCSICEREERDRLRGNITELLRIQPWLSYEECQAFYKCDRILFNAVRDGLKGYYFEKVRQGFATKKDELMAVLFLSEKQPEEITTKIYENTLAYLRKDAPMQRFRR